MTFFITRILKSSSILPKGRELVRQNDSRGIAAALKLKSMELYTMWPRLYSSSSQASQSGHAWGAFSPSSPRRTVPAPTPTPTPSPAVKVNITKTSGSSNKIQTDDATKMKTATSALPEVSGGAGAGADADTGAKVKIDACGPDPDEEDDEADLEQMFILGPAGMEWGGPTRGGRRPEPTRYGDWERKGRASDF